MLNNIISLLAVSSPATGDSGVSLPLILGIIALFLIVAMVVLNVLKKKK